MAVLEKTRERHSGLPKRAEKISTGLPSQEAPYSTVCPSGANLAFITLPFRKVSRWNTGAGAFAPAPTRLPAKNDAATRIMAASASPAAANRGSARPLSGAGSATFTPDCVERASR